MRTGLAILSSVALLACSDTGTGTADGSSEITLKYGETYDVPGENLTISFADVVDSRCPKDAVCLWPGNGQVVLSLMIGRTEFVRDVNTFVEPRAAEFSSFVIELKRLDPYPDTQDPTSREDYVATMVLRRMP